MKPNPCSTFLFVLFVAFLSCPLFGQNSAEQAAERYWNALPSHADADSLDEFIARYPNTDTAKLAFMTRYFLLTQDTVQRIHSAKNEQELRNIIVQFAGTRGMNSSAILYAMDYVL